MRRTFYFDFSACICIEVTIASLIAVFSALGQYQTVSLLFAASFIIELVYVVGSFFPVSRQTDTLLLFIAISLINIIFDGLLENGSILSFNYYKKIIMFMEFMLLLASTWEIGGTVSQKIIDWISLAPVLASVFLILSYYFLGNTQASGVGITLGFGNSNFAGMWLLHLFLYDCLYILKVFHGGKKIRLFCIPIAFLIGDMIWKTGTRSCTIAVIAFFVLLLLGRKNKRVNKPVAFLMACFPLLFAVVYLQVVDRPWFRQAFAFLTSTGKTLVSREAIWKNCFRIWKKDVFFGVYSGISGGTGVSQCHNTHVDVLVTYGIVPFIFFIKFLYTAIVQTVRNSRSGYSYAAFCAFCSVIIMGCFEASVLASSMGLGLLTVGFLTIANQEKETTGE